MRLYAPLETFSADPLICRFIEKSVSLFACSAINGYTKRLHSNDNASMTTWSGWYMHMSLLTVFMSWPQRVYSIEALNARH
jgi:hypothetical protein